MSTLTRTAFRTRLSSDATLVALLTGGIHDKDTLGTNRLDLAYLVAAGKVTATGGVKPFAYLQWAASQAMSRFRDDKLRLDVYVYEEDGASVLEGAVERIRALLHRWKPAANADESVLDVIYGMVSQEFLDEDLGNANGRFIRFEIQLTRKES